MAAPHRTAHGRPSGSVLAAPSSWQVPASSAHRSTVTPQRSSRLPEGVDTGCSLPVSLPPGEGNLTSSCRTQPGGQRTSLGTCSGPGPTHLAPQGVRHGLPSRGRQPWSFDTGPREVWELTSEVRVGEGRVGQKQSGHFRQRYQVQRQEGGRDGGLPGTIEESSQVSESFYIIRGTWKVALRSFCTRGTLGCPRGYCDTGVNAPKADRRTPGQVQTVALSLDSREEAPGSAEDRLQSFVLTPREAATPCGARGLAPVLSCRLRCSAMGGGGLPFTGPPQARC